MRKHSGQSGRLDRGGGIVSGCVFVLAPACSVHQMNDKRRWGGEEGAGWGRAGGAPCLRRGWSGVSVSGANPCDCWLPTDENLGKCSRSAAHELAVA